MAGSRARSRRHHALPAETGGRSTRPAGGQCVIRTPAARLICHASCRSTSIRSAALRAIQPSFSAFSFMPMPSPRRHPVFPRIRFVQSIQTTQPEPRWHWWVQRIAARRAEGIVVPSASVADAARSRSAVPEPKITVIPNALDPVDFRWFPTRRPRGRRGRAAGDRLHRRLDPIKRLPDLIEAVKLLEEQARLHIFGDGAERGALERLTADRKLESHVVFHGAVPRPQEALRQVGMLILPSAAEGFGLVLIEAMVSGVPVVATDVAGIRDVVRHGQTGNWSPSHPRRTGEGNPFIAE